MNAYTLSTSELENTLDRLQNFCDDDLGTDVYMTAIVKASEFFIETLWKTAKKILIQAGYPDDLFTGPKMVFKTLHERAIITQEELFILCDFLDYRNKSAHKYGHQIIEEMYPFIKEHYKTLISIGKKLEILTLTHAD